MPPPTRTTSSNPLGAPINETTPRPSNPRPSPGQPQPREPYGARSEHGPGGNNGGLRGPQLVEPYGHRAQYGYLTSGTAQGLVSGMSDITINASRPDSAYPSTQRATSGSERRSSNNNHCGMSSRNIMKAARASVQTAIKPPASKIGHVHGQ